MTRENKAIIFSAIIAASAAIIASVLTALISGHYNEINNQKLIESTLRATDKSIEGNLKAAATTNKTNMEINKKLIGGNQIAVEKNIKGNLEATRLSNENHFKGIELTLQNNLETIKRNKEIAFEKEKREQEKEIVEAANLIAGDILSRLVFLETQLKMYKKAEMFTKSPYPGSALISSFISPAKEMFFVENFQHYFSKTISILPKKCLDDTIILYRMFETQQKMVIKIINEPSLKINEPYKNVMILRKLFKENNALNENTDLILGRIIYFLHTMPLESIIKFTNDCISRGYYALACLNECALKDVNRKSTFESKGKEFETTSLNLSQKNEKIYEQFLTDLKEIVTLGSKLEDAEFPDLWMLQEKLYTK